MSPVLNTASALRLGTQPVAAVYLGASRVWTPPVSSWTPASLPGLVVWLDAAQLTGADGAAVSPWPNLADATKPGTIVGTPAPVVRANALKGQRVVRFTANEGRVRGANVFGGGALAGYNLTLAYVSRTVGPTIGRIFTALYPGANYLVGYHTSAYECMYDNGWVNTGVGWPARPTPWKLYGADSSHDGANYLTRFLIDGVVSGSAATGSGMGTQGWNLSGYSATGTEETCDCEVAEVVLYDRKLSDADRVTVETYLRGKWL